MRVTRLGVKGIVFYAMLVLAFYAAPYLNLFFLLLTFATVLAVLNLWWTWRNLAGVSGSVTDLAPVPAHAGQLAHATLDPARHPRHDLHVTALIDGTRHFLASHVELRRGEPRKCEIVTPALPRGAHAIERLEVTSIYPFGTLRRSVTLEGPGELLVYPAPADLSRYRDRNGVAGPGALGGRAALEMGPAGLREYRPGDELRDVHWKATARRGDLVIKEMEGDVSPGMEVVLDLRAADEVLEEALSLTVALALECKENKELFSLRTQNHSGTYGTGHAAFDDLLAYLARVQSVGERGPAPAPASPAVLRLPLPARRHAGRPARDEVGA